MPQRNTRNDNGTSGRFVQRCFFHGKEGYITHSNSGEGLLFYGDVTIPFVDRFPRGEIYNLLTTRPEDLKNEAKTE